ncbi:hypothetical protein BKA80DRAFT_98229 [Phyllosticta citrichinensis]
MDGVGGGRATGGGRDGKRVPFLSVVSFSFPFPCLSPSALFLLPPPPPPPPPAPAHSLSLRACRYLQMDGWIEVDDGRQSEEGFLFFTACRRGSVAAAVTAAIGGKGQGQGQVQVQVQGKRETGPCTSSQTWGREAILGRKWSSRKSHQEASFPRHLPFTMLLLPVHPLPFQLFAEHASYVGLWKRASGLYLTTTTMMMMMMMMDI